MNDISERDLDTLLDRLEEAITDSVRRKHRLEALREFLSEREWRDFCYDHPEAEQWFNENGAV